MDTRGLVLAAGLLAGVGCDDGVDPGPEVVDACVMFADRCLTACQVDEDCSPGEACLEEVCVPSDEPLGEAHPNPIFTGNDSGDAGADGGIDRSDIIGHLRDAGM